MYGDVKQVKLVIILVQRILVKEIDPWLLEYCPCIGFVIVKESSSRANVSGLQYWQAILYIIGAKIR